MVVIRSTVALNSERGACSNDLREREDWLEDEVLPCVQSKVLRPEIVDFAVEEFGVQLKARLSGLSSTLDVDRERKAVLELELDRLWAVAAQGHGFDSLQGQIAQRDRELREITNRLLSQDAGSIESCLEEIRCFVDRGLRDIRSLLRSEAGSFYAGIRAAWAKLSKYVKEVRMSPQQVRGTRFYVADGNGICWVAIGAAS